MLVYDNILLNNGFLMPCSMNIDNHYIFFLDNVDIDLLVFLKIFLDNEGVDIISHLTYFLHFAHTFHPSYFQKQWHPLSFCLVFYYSSLRDNTIIFGMYIL
jgi:hypothetical protein